MTFVSQHITKKIQSLCDEQLIEFILKTGLTDNLGELYDRYANKVYGKCILMVKDKDLAKDLAQEVLVKAFLKINTFQNKSSFAAWLYQVTYTYCIDYFRKNKKNIEQELEENQDYSGNNSAIEDNENEILEIKVEQLSLVLEALKPEEKVILLLKYQDDLSIQEIAAMQNTTESAVKMKLKRARDKAKEIKNNTFYE